MYAPESIELLQKSGIDFQRHEEMGILPNDFAELMITSGLVLTDETKWISFHRCARAPTTSAIVHADQKSFFGGAVVMTLGTSSSSSRRSLCPRQKTRFSRYCIRGSQRVMISRP